MLPATSSTDTQGPFATRSDRFATKLMRLAVCRQILHHRIRAAWTLSVAMVRRMAGAGTLHGGVIIMRSTGRVAVLFIALSVSGLLAADWPGYMGPRRDGTSTEKGLLRTWPKEGPKVLWTTPLGVGFGGPAVSKGRVYLLDRDEKVGDTLRVYDLATGKELWNYAYDAPGSFMFNGSRTVPSVDGDLVYTCGPLGDLHAVNVNTHKVAWHKNVWKDFGGGSALMPARQPPSGMRGVQSGGPAGQPSAAQPGAGRPGAATGGPPAGRRTPR